MNAERLAEVRKRVEKGSGKLVVKEDVQKLYWPNSWVAYAPATGPELEKDLVQMGLFWHKQEAELYAHARQDISDLLALVDELVGKIKYTIEEEDSPWPHIAGPHNTECAWCREGYPNHKEYCGFNVLRTTLNRIGGQGDE